ncbi:MAG TPA: MerR family transcriptional regulator [Xanthobacteraceae bacterium]|nr:MerR family transcriptional regulator [Xanthobacteraceae bacterium]
MDKAPDAFRTISEVAEDLDLPQHVLRFWETRFSHIKPMKRGGGRRYYRPDDIDLLRGIRHLLYGEGYTIRGVQRILKDEGVKFVQSVWKAGAPQPERSPADRQDLGEAPPPARPLPGARARGDAEVERGRGLFGLLPSLLGSVGEHLQDTGADERAERLEPSIEDIFAEVPTSPGEPSADRETDDHDDGSLNLPGMAEARAPTPEARLFSNGSGATQIGISPDDKRKLQAMLHELAECRRMLAESLMD